MPMFRVIPVWVVGLCMLMLTAGVFIGRATSSPLPSGQSSSPAVPSDMVTQPGPNGWHNFDCRTPRRQIVCHVDVLGPEGVQVGSYAEWTTEVKLDGRTQTERYQCGPIKENRAASCTQTLQGAIFTGGLVTTTFTLANGEQRTLSFRTHCYTNTPEGQVCP